MNTFLKDTDLLRDVFQFFFSQIHQIVEATWPLMPVATKAHIPPKSDI